MLRKTHCTKLPQLQKAVMYTSAQPFSYYYWDEVPFSAVASLVRINQMKHPVANIFCKINPDSKLTDILAVGTRKCLYFAESPLKFQRAMAPLKEEAEMDLDEATRTELLAKARIDTRDRYERRRTVNIGNMRCKVDDKALRVSNPKKRAFRFRFLYKGTEEYILTVEFKAESIIHAIVKELTSDESKNKGKKLDKNIIEKVLTEAFESDDLWIDCTCPDFRYRFAYAATKHDHKAMKPETRPSKITNPKARGIGCKHLIKVLSNPTWMQKCAILALTAIKRVPMQLFFPYVSSMSDLNCLR